MPNISLRLKRLGKKRLHTVPYRVSDDVNTLADLIRAAVAGEVERFNASRTEPKLFAFLTPAEIQDQAEDGKVGFGDISNTQTADLETAVETALQAHTDGVFLVFIDDEEIRALRDEISLEDGHIVTFLRLTFLTGTLW